MKLSHVVLSIVIVVLLSGIGYVFYHDATTPTYSTVAVVRGPLVQEVSASGNVATPTTIDLQFQNTGKIHSVDVQVGDSVAAGDVVAHEDTTVLDAELVQARAAVATQTATLAALQAGTRPEQIAIDQTAVTQAQQAVRNTIQVAYATADDAVHNKVDQFFTNPRVSSAKLAFTVPDAQLQSRVEQERVAIEPMLTSWQAQVTAASFSSADTTGLTQTAQANLNMTSQFLNDANEALAKTQPSPQVSATALTTYETAVAAGRLAVANSLSAVTAAATTLATAQGALTLAQAGSTAEAIQTQQARIAEAQASVAAIEAQMTQTNLVTPVAGTVTAVNNHPGEVVLPTTVVVSILPAERLQINVNLSEDNVASVTVGDVVRISLDAFPGEVWQGTVTKIDPAETIIGGAIYYTTTVLFDTTDSRIKTGMTANVLIQTGASPDALIVPASAVQMDGTQPYVQVLQGGTVERQNVSVGLQSQDGRVELRSGVHEGDHVITSGP